MSIMGYGYGSEYQLMRYLGHHRSYLDGQIQQVTGSKSPIRWFDYPVIKNAFPQDGELKNIDCFKNESFYTDIQSKWKKFWPQRGNSHNWDGVFCQDDYWYFVEAKAHIAEAHQKCFAKEGYGKAKILQAFTSTCDGNKVMANQWIESDCYQLANRLAFIYFCKSNNINAKLCLICFVSGYCKDPSKDVLNKGIWEKLWEEEYTTLMLNDNHKRDIVHVYIDCYNCYKG